MILQAKILPIIFILLHIVTADEPRASSKNFRDRNFRLTIAEESSPLLEVKTPSKQTDYFLLSLNRPSKLSFRRSTTRKFYVDAVIERLTGNSSNKAECFFPVFDDDDSSNLMKLWSLKNNMEIFIHFKLCEDINRNMLNIYVINMTDCQYTKTEALQGYDYHKNGKIFFVFRPWDINEFDIFTFNGKHECDSHMCKRIYNIKTRSISKPNKFLLSQDWTIYLILPSEEEAGYYSGAVKNGKSHLLSLTADGSLTHYLENTLESKIVLSAASIYHDFFALCWIEERRKREVSCTHLNPKLNINANVSVDIGYEPKQLQMHNTPQGGFLVLTVSCSDEECLEHEIKVTRFDAFGFHGEFIRFKDEGCAPIKEQRFTFYEEKGRLCLFYACDWKGKLPQRADSTVRIKCLR